MPSREDTLAEQLAQLQRLYEQGLLSEVNYRAALDGLGVDAGTVFNQREQQVDEQINVAHDYVDQRRAGTAIHLHVERAGNVTVGPTARPGEQPLTCPPALSEEEATACYLRYVVEANRRLQLQGIRSAGRLVSVDLERVYVTLAATGRRAVEDEEAWLQERARLAPGEATRLASMQGEPARERFIETRVKVQEALAAHPRLVVLGDPGSGKTTLLRYLALTYARDLLGEERLVTQRLQLAERRLPVLLPLRDLARHLELHHPDPGLDGSKQLLDYLRIYFENQGLLLPERFFADRLGRGECAMLLDGVDEVANARTRQRVARLIERFVAAYPDNRYVVASRVVGYSGAARLGAGYVVTTVRDFTWADIESFVTYWNLAVELALSGEDNAHTRHEAQQQAAALLGAIRANERVRELAVNPLLLTVIALVHRYRAQLPERRSELYEEAIEVLLAKWDEAKGLESTAFLRGVELDAGDRRSLLEPVALWMMERHAREIEVGELRGQLVERFRTLTPDRERAGKAVDDFLNLIAERSGLLAERGIGVYAFSHLTFQEHLAARAVADREDYVAYSLARLGDSWWREVILLQAGYLSTQGKRRATALIRAIMDAPKEPALYHNLTLAAECLRDAGPARVEGDLWAEVLGRLQHEFETPLRRPARRADPALADRIRRRAAAAEALARIQGGGPGTQPAFWRLPYGEPVWVDVPAGAFWMGSEQGREEERPLHRLHLEAFQIARTPITNAQYRLFVEATGHRAPRHWEDGRVPRDQESHPVVYVSWHDAMAYCRWLSEVTGKAIALPSEAQWEKAARGRPPPQPSPVGTGEGEEPPPHRPQTVGPSPVMPTEADASSADKDVGGRATGEGWGGGPRIYPWGDTWQEGRCNSKELGLEDTTPVGIFPDGASPYGCLDMAGQVWEWTRSLWGPWTGQEARLEFGYPYDPADGREDLEAGDDMLRVLRGGSAWNNADAARCASRYWLSPYLFWNHLGFRVCVSPIPALHSVALRSALWDSGMGPTGKAEP